MRFNIALNDEERKEAQDFVNELLKKKDLECGDFVESGYFGVKVSDIFDEVILFDVYRINNTIQIKKQKKVKKK